jgi:hypothetical protein
VGIVERKEEEEELVWLEHRAWPLILKKSSKLTVKFWNLENNFEVFY